MGIAFVNSTGATIATAASTWSLALPVVTAGGSLHIGVGCATSNVTVSTMTDNTTNVYIKTIACPSPLPAATAELWHVLNSPASATRVSVTLSGASSGSIGSVHFTGLSTNNALLGTGSSAATGNSTTVGATTITPSSSGVAIMFSRLTASSIGTITAAANYTAWLNTNTCVRTFGQYWIQSTPTATDGQYIHSSRCSHAAVLAYFSDTTVVNSGKGCPCFTLLGVC